MSKEVAKNELGLEKDLSIDFFSDIASLIQEARKNIVRNVNSEMCITYYKIGEKIVEEQQKGETRAEYGRAVLKQLSEFLTDRFGAGFSVTNLKNARKLYLTYKNETISQTLSDLFKLGWSHYIFLMNIDDKKERDFYQVESENENWSLRQLKRQYHSSLYERLALSRDKKEVLELSNVGQVVAKPEDIIKTPLVLEFLGLEEKEHYTELDLETKIIDKLEEFLLELGKGFLFEARQKRFSFDGDDFYVDLVFYNRLLKCYVLIDLKIGELKHQDLGQMMMYVNYFDKYIKQDSENPTIGLVLVKKTKESIVELTVPDKNIYAPEYSLYLPEKEILQQKLDEWYNETVEAIRDMRVSEDDE